MLTAIRRHKALTICLLIVILISLITIGESRSFKKCVENDAQLQHKNLVTQSVAASSCVVSFFGDHDKLINTLSTFGLVLVTFGLVVSGMMQTDTARKQLRAYIGVDEMQNPDHRHIHPASSGILRATALMKNFGPTPALRVQYALGLQVIPGELPVEIFNTAIWSKKQIIQPTQEVVTSINDSEAVDPVTWAAVRTGRTKMNIFVFGLVKYEDIFGSKHFTQFCFRVDYRNGPSSPPGWDWYQDYNKTDDQKEHLTEYIARFAKTPFRWGLLVGRLIN